MASLDDRIEVSSGEPRTGSSRLVAVAHYVVAAVLIGGGLLYWWMKPSRINPMADNRSAEAMALVQTHQALQAPTVRHAIDAQVQRLQAQGKGVRPGEWRVVQESPDTYLVSIIVREQGSHTWFEREYLWRVHLAKRRIEPISMAAENVMPISRADRDFPQEPRR